MLTENSSRSHMSNPHSPHSSASGWIEQEQLLRVEALQLLRQEADEPYRIFSGKLLPPETPLLGVRIPRLRQLAKSWIKEGKAGEYLALSRSSLLYHEEFMFYALLTAGIKIPEPDKIAMIKNFVPCINNWAVCDIFCGDLKEVGKNPAPFYQEFKTYLHSAREYEIRFFYVLALMYFLTPEYLPELLSAVSSQVFVGFYDKMAAAWFLSVAYVKFPHEVEDFLQTAVPDKFVFRKSISKICDSYRVGKEDKKRLRAMAAKRLKFFP